MGPGRVPLLALLARLATQHVLQHLKAAMRSTIAGVAARLSLCWAAGHVMIGLSVLQPAQQDKRAAQ